MSHGFTFKGFSGSGERLVAFTNATGQTASIGSTTLFTAPAAGFYRLAAYAVASASALGIFLSIMGAQQRFSITLMWGKRLNC